MAQRHDIRPFTIAIADKEILDPRERLSRTRCPLAIVPDSSDGTDLAYLRDILTYWCDEFDWRAQEARLNAFPQFVAWVGDDTVHFLYVRGSPMC
jgi:microsomal epoxide hydrolase